MVIWQTGKGESQLVENSGVNNKVEAADVYKPSFQEIQQGWDEDRW
jgi:hypothetical protein